MAMDTDGMPYREVPIDQAPSDSPMLTISAMMVEICEVNIAKGWRAPDGGLCPGQTFGDYIALLHSEAGEALEAYRDHRLADATAAEPDWPNGDDDPEDGPTSRDFNPKPEGVGSEFADVLIRLLDMCDVFGIRVSGYDILSQIHNHTPLSSRIDIETFGDHIAWLHYEISLALISPAQLAMVLRTLGTIARKFKIDLEAEYRRKIAYNRTRGFQHGGRTLADPEVRHLGDEFMTPICEDSNHGKVTVVVADSDRVNCQACNRMIQEKS